MASPSDSLAESTSAESLSVPTPVTDTDTETSGLSPRGKKTPAKSFYDAGRYDSSSSVSDAGVDAAYVAVILGTEHIMPEKGKPFTAYKVRVQNRDGMKWVAIRRYSEFRSLMEKLKSVYGHSVVPHKFPPKKILGNLDPLHIDKRHMALQTWFNKVLHSPELGTCPELVRFMEDNKLDEGLVEISYEEAMVKLDLEKIGYMYRLGRKKEWKKNWYILRHGVLYKYKSHTDKHMYGKYVVSGARVSKVEGAAYDFCFAVSPPKGKQLLFAALSQEEQDEWMMVLGGNTTDETGAGDSGGTKVLGVPLEKVRYTDDIGLPIFLTCLLTYIEATALGMEELFTKPPDPVLIGQIEEGELDFELIKDPHAVAGLIQLFLRELPLPVCTADLHDCFVGVFEIQNEEIQEQALVGLVNCLPPLHYNLLYRLLSFLGELEQHGSEALSDHLAKTFSVLLLRAPKNPQRPLDLKYEKQAVTAVTKLLIKHREGIIPEPLSVEDQGLFSDEEYLEDATPRDMDELGEQDVEDIDDMPVQLPAGVGSPMTKKEQKAQKERLKQEEKERKKLEKEGKKKAVKEPASPAPEEPKSGLAFMSKKELKKREKAIREAEKKLERERKEQGKKQKDDKKAILSPRKKKKEEGEEEEKEEKEAIAQAESAEGGAEAKDEKKKEKKEKKKEREAGDDAIEDAKAKKAKKKAERKKKAKKEGEEAALEGEAKGAVIEVDANAEVTVDDEVSSAEEEMHAAVAKEAAEMEVAEKKLAQEEAEREAEKVKMEAKEKAEAEKASADAKAALAAEKEAAEKAAADAETALAAEREAEKVKKEKEAKKVAEKAERDAADKKAAVEKKAADEKAAHKAAQKAEEESKQAEAKAKEGALAVPEEASSDKDDASEEAKTDGVANSEQEANDEDKEDEPNAMDSEEEEEEEKALAIAAVPVSDRQRLVGAQKMRTVGPRNRRRPTRGQKVTIATSTFYVPEEPKAPPPKKLTPQQQMMMEMSRVIKRR